MAAPLWPSITCGSSWGCFLLGVSPGCPFCTLFQFTSHRPAPRAVGLTGRSFCRLWSARPRYGTHYPESNVRRKRLQAPPTPRKRRAGAISRPQRAPEVENEELRDHFFLRRIPDFRFCDVCEGMWRRRDSERANLGLSFLCRRRIAGNRKSATVKRRGPLLNDLTQTQESGDLQISDRRCR